MRIDQIFSTATRTTYHITMVGSDRVKVKQKGYPPQVYTLDQLGKEFDRRLPLERWNTLQRAYSFLLKQKGLVK